MSRTSLRAAGVLLALFPLAGCVSPSAGLRSPLLAVEHALLFHPSAYGNWQTGPELFSEATIETPDGVRLHGWYAEVPQPQAVVLYCHGNAGNVTSRRSVVRLFREGLNCTILVFDYRGYGRSEGTPSEEGLLTDARAARRWLATRSRVAVRDTVVVGNSLGGGVAVDLAAREGARALVLENTFTSVPEAAGHHFWPLPVDKLVTTRLDSLAKIACYQGPLLQTHGDADRVIPFALGRKLFDAANEPKHFVRVSGGGHNDPPTREYVMALRQFLTDLPRPSSLEHP